jgi:hypothetical protein
MRSFNWTIRLARDADAPTLEKLIPLSVRELQSEYYSAAQMEAAIGSVFGVDRQLIRDGTYFVVEYEGEIVGCGGWSRRKKLFGSDAIGIGEDATLDPKWEPARIRAFFVHPRSRDKGLRTPFSWPAKKRCARKNSLRHKWSRLCRANCSMLRSATLLASATKSR